MYRTDATTLQATAQAEHTRAIQPELDALIAEARSRRLRVWGGLVAALSAVFATLLLSLFFSQGKQQSARCHQVSIVWEDAPHVPGPSWRVCK
jgi:hypothetical protein